MRGKMSQEERVKILFLRFTRNFGGGVKFCTFFCYVCSIFRKEELDLSLGVGKKMKIRRLLRRSFFSNLHCKNVVSQFHET